MERVVATGSHPAVRITLGELIAVPVVCVSDLIGGRPTRSITDKGGGPVRRVERPVLRIDSGGCACSAPTFGELTRWTNIGDVAIRVVVRVGSQRRICAVVSRRQGPNQPVDGAVDEGAGLLVAIRSRSPGVHPVLADPRDAQDS